MIEFSHVTFRHATAGSPVLRDVDLTVPEGQLALVTGPTGSGKSTLLGLVNGHVPHFTGGELAGHVRVDGRDTRDFQPRDLADVVGVVSQDPLAGFVTDTVEQELAFGMEQLGTPPATMRTRVEDAIDLLSIAGLRGRRLATLSGGEQQRVAIASVLAAGARVLVLDEPTSALDPTSAEEVLAALLRLVHDVGVTVLVAEHRLERVIGYADAVITINDGEARLATPEQAMATSPLAPPVVRLGRLMGWAPLPLSVRDARAQAGELRTRLDAKDPADYPTHPAFPLSDGGLTVKNLRVTYGDVTAVDDVSLSVPAGSVIALMGRNGSGKSSLLWALTGVGPHDAGSWQADGDIRLVPQSASDLLYLNSVQAELARADASNGRRTGTARAILDELVPGIDDTTHPRDLSAGQQLALVLATQLSRAPTVVLLDEPTRGLDYPAKAALARSLGRLSGRGKAVLVATHDVEFAAAVADNVAVLATGELIAHGPTADIMTSSVTFAPQVAKVLRPAHWLTVQQVEAALK